MTNILKLELCIVHMPTDIRFLAWAFAFRLRPKRELQTKNKSCGLTVFPVSILYKSIAGRNRLVRIADGPITARHRFIKNASWVVAYQRPTRWNQVGMCHRNIRIMAHFHNWNFTVLNRYHTILTRYLVILTRYTTILTRYSTKSARYLAI